MKLTAPRRWAVALAAAAVGFGIVGPSVASPAAAAAPTSLSPTSLSSASLSPTSLSLASLTPRAAVAPLAPAAWTMTATGRLVDENGWPIAGISLYPYDTGTYFSADPVVTARDGSFTITAVDDWSDVPAAAYPARAELYEGDFWQFINAAPLRFTLRPGTTVDLGTITVRSAEHTGRAAGSVNTASKKAVRTLYRKGYAAKVRREKPVKVTGCTVAKTPKKLQKRELSALNTVRSLAGVEPVTLSAKLSKRASQAALVQYKNGYPGHYPSTSATCATKTGVAASSESNLSFYRIGAINILDYMIDPGRSNREAGHRGWFLTPGLEKVGTGYAVKANAFHVTSKQDDSNSQPLWVPWPTEGWFPAQMEPAGRWSFMSSRSDLDFSHAKVSMKVAGKTVKKSVYRKAGGGTLTGVSWDLAKPITVKGSKTVTAKVTISNIVLRGTTVLPPVTYTVKLFNA